MQHASLTTERWAAFAPGQRLLMIANELNRASARIGPEDGRSRRLSYQRALRLTDLTIQLADRPGLRRELLRWRDLLKDRLREGLRRTRGRSLRGIVAELTQYLRGWLGYCRTTETPSVLIKLQSWIHRKLRCY